MHINSAEMALCTSVRELEYGTLFPVELPVSGRTQDSSLSAPFAQLIHACRMYGTPEEVRVVAGRPVHAIFGVETDIGPALKHIQIK